MLTFQVTGIATFSALLGLPLGKNVTEAFSSSQRNFEYALDHVYDLHQSGWSKSWHIA